jgi:hypothetical protein
VVEQHPVQFFMDRLTYDGSKNLSQALHERSRVIRIYSATPIDPDEVPDV